MTPLPARCLADEVKRASLLRGKKKKKAQNICSLLVTKKKIILDSDDISGLIKFFSTLMISDVQTQRPQPGFETELASS